MGSYTLGNTGEYFEAIGAGKGAARGIFPVLNRFQILRIPQLFCVVSLKVVDTFMLPRHSDVSGLSSEGSYPEGKAVGEISFENVSFAYPSRPEVPVRDAIIILCRALS